MPKTRSVLCNSAGQTELSPFRAVLCSRAGQTELSLSLSLDVLHLLSLLPKVARGTVSSMTCKIYIVLLCVFTSLQPQSPSPLILYLTGTRKHASFLSWMLWLLQGRTGIYQTRAFRYEVVGKLAIIAITIQSLGFRSGL